jgi:hypothetical protein
MANKNKIKMVEKNENKLENLNKEFCTVFLA